MNSVFITGITGFLGTHIARRLHRAGWQLHGLKRPSSTLEALGNLASAIVWHTTETTTNWSWLESLPAVNSIIHCATSYGKSGNELAEVLATNVLLPLKLLEWGKANNIKLFMNVDTCYEMGYGYLPAYTLSKHQFRAWGELLARNWSGRFINLKLFHPYGPLDRPSKFIPWIINQCLCSTCEIRLTRGEQKKDFLYVEDVAEAILVGISRVELLPVGFHQWECGSGKAVSIRDLVETIHELSRSTAKLNFGSLDYRENEEMFSQADPVKLIELGWRPRIALRDGLTKTIESMEHHGSRA